MLVPAFRQVIIQYINGICLQQQMNWFNLFHPLKSIVQYYSSLPVSRLMCQSLTIQIVIPVLAREVSNCLKFDSRGQMIILKKNTHYGCLIINHKQIPKIQKKLLDRVDNCIIVDDDFNQSNNLLYSQYSQLKEGSRAYLIGLGAAFSQTEKEQFEYELEMLLTIVELFHSHIHLKVYMHGLEGNLKQVISQGWSTEDDDEFFQTICENSYLRILDERASKININELKSMYDVNKSEWGQTIRIGNGTRYLVIWVTVNRFPLMKPLILSKKKGFSLQNSSSLGYSIIRNNRDEELVDEPSLYTTTILNFSQGYSYEEILSILNVEYQLIIEEFKLTRQKEKADRKFKMDVVDIQRISEMLEIDSAILFNNVFIRQL